MLCLIGGVAIFSSTLAKNPAPPLVLSRIPARPWQLVLVPVHRGFATAILGPVAVAAIADTFEERRGERMAWYSSATMIGRFLAPFVGGILIFGDDFHWVYLADGFAGVMALLAAIR